MMPRDCLSHTPLPLVSQVRLFSEHEVPWDRLAFDTGATALRHYFACMQRGVFTPLQTTFERPLRVRPTTTQ